MNNEVLWFGYLAIDRKIVSIDAICDLRESFGPQADVVDYAQAVLDNGWTTDFEAVQELINEACNTAASDGKPPVDVFVKRTPLYERDDFGDNVASTSVVMKANRENLDEPNLTRLPRLDDDGVRELMSTMLRWARSEGASDLHLSAGSFPFLRVNQEIRKFGMEALNQIDSHRLNTAFLSPSELEIFEGTGDLDVALAIDDTNRFRVNLMTHKQGTAGTYRLVPNKALTLTELGFTNRDVLEKFLDHHNGLILITGPVGSGKTTTLASMIDFLNQKRQDHIITVEDPIEVVQISKGCAVTQRQVGAHTESFANALKGALREDPDIIAIGELRDLETIEMAITAAETGHLVIGTLHTQDAATTLNRILDVFPPSQQPQIRAMAAESLRGIICQRLIPAEAGGLTVVCEVLTNTLAVANMIRDGKIHLLKQALETGMAQGMCTMDQAVVELYDKELISKKVAAAQVRDNALKKRILSGEQASAPRTDGSKPHRDAIISDEPQDKKKGWFR